MLLPHVRADGREVRLPAVSISLVLALAAVVLAVAPSVLLRHRAHPLPVVHDATVVYAIPLAGGPPRALRVLRGQWAFPVATADGRALVLEQPSIRRTELWRLPLAGGRLVHVGSKRVFTAPSPRGRFRATIWHTMHHGILTVHNPDGSVAWRHAVFPQTSEYAVAPDGASAVVPTNAGLVVLRRGSSRLLVRGPFVDPSYSPDGRTIYAARVKEAVSIPK